MKYASISICALCSLLFFACSPEIQSEIKITCPDDVAVKIPSATYPSGGLNLPEPEIFSACGVQGSPSYIVDIAPEIAAGSNKVTYTATNPCGDEASCSFVVTATVDIRAKFVGKYTGYRDCTAVNTNQLHPDEATTVQVDYGNAPDRLLVGADQVTVDSNGNSLYPTFNGYRMYDLHFKNDSIFVYQQWGVINAHEVCEFRGKKN